MPDSYGRRPRARRCATASASSRWTRSRCSPAWGWPRRHLGLGATYSTTYYEPFHVARVFATLDLMVGGRAAWNVVTSLNDSEAPNFGQAEHPEHDLRYDRADEFMEVVLGHWDSWEDDAIVLDKEGGLFADPAKVHRLDHDGQWFRSRGPVHRAALAAGPSGHHPGRPERPRPRLRGALGRAGLRASIPTSRWAGRQYRRSRTRSPRSGATPTASASRPADLRRRRRDQGDGARTSAP